MFILLFCVLMEMEEKISIQFAKNPGNNEETEKKSAGGDSSKQGEFGTVLIEKGLHRGELLERRRVCKQPESPCLTFSSFQEFELIHGKGSQ